MGFSSVYRVLQEVFPQVDPRLLRAVAIEHPKDADTAVEVVLVEVIPFLSQQSATVGQSDASSSSVGHSDCDTTAPLEKSIHVEPADVLYLSAHSTEAGHFNNNESLPSPSEALGADTSNQPDGTIVVEHVPAALEDSLLSSFHDENETGRVCAVDVDEEPAPLENWGENSKAINSHGDSSASVCENGSNDDHVQGCAEIGGEQATSLGNSEVTSTGDSRFIQEGTALGIDGTTETKKEYRHLYFDYETLNEMVMPVTSESSQFNALPDLEFTVPEELDPISYSKAPSGKDAFALEMVNTEDECAMNSVVTRSGEVCSTELLEDIIEDARNNKKTLVSAMDSVISLMREVEHKEEAAEQAKEEASRGCLDILAKVDELKQALQHAKEANDMHAGEVYAEKAILATEMKELQLRLLSLSDERDRSLGLLDEMRKALEERLDAALKVMETIEQEKLEKEKSAREALSYQESQMEKVVEEAKMLQREADENSKLQEFLMDRGRVVDMLQGEISVKCQDVRLLKERFDKRIPLSKSLSSSQASSILASSSSSLKSVRKPSDPEHEMTDSYETQKKNEEIDDSYGFLEKSVESRVAQSPKAQMIETVPIIDSPPPATEKQSHDRWGSVDDGWELFENGDY